MAEQMDMNSLMELARLRMRDKNEYDNLMATMSEVLLDMSKIVTKAQKRMMEDLGMCFEVGGKV
jgi:hypothetical protein